MSLVLSWSVWPAMERRVGVFTLCYWAGLSAAALAAGAPNTGVYVPLMVLLIGVVAWVHDRWQLSGPVLWGLSLWGLAHMAGGLVAIPDSYGSGDILYTLWLWDGALRYDQVLHGAGLFVATAALLQIAGHRRRPLLWAFASAQALGWLNEVIEHVGATALPTANIGDIVNTGWDLAFNAAGGVAAVLASRRLRLPAVPLPPSSQRVVDAAREHGLEIDVSVFPQGTKTAADAAAAIGCAVSAIVKSLVFVVDGKPVLALIPGDRRLDQAKLAAAVGGEHARRAGLEEVRSATGYAAGGTPPFGHPDRPLEVIADPSLRRNDPVWAAAGTPTTVFPISLADLSRTTSPRWEDVTET